MPKADPCQKYACKIQDCLQANNWQENKCQTAIENLRKCCERFQHLDQVCCRGIKLATNNNKND